MNNYQLRTIAQKVTNRYVLYHRFKKMKVEIVKFNEGEYAVRVKRLFSTRYVNLTNWKYGAIAINTITIDCIGSYQQAEKVYNRLMGGTVVK